ncbi:MAG: AbgT family transporter [Planctomycetota bacterium]|jgi:aminobenzoyl-glutamate transport protein
MTDKPSPESARERASDRPRSGVFARFLDGVEWLGNLLPHPVTLFALFAVGVVLASWAAATFGLEVADPRPEGAKGRSADGVIRAVSLLDGDGLKWIAANVVKNFTGFAPLGTVLVALLGVGVAEKSGLLSAVIRALVLSAPSRLVTAVVVFAGVLSNTASEMGYVVLIPLAAAVFHAIGRHPVAGLAAAFAGVSGGYSANLLVGTVDPLLAGITTSAAQFIDPDYEVNAMANWYFMFVSTFMITVIGTWVTTVLVEPRLGRYDASAAAEDLPREPTLDALEPAERRGLKRAAMAFGLLLLGLIWIWGPRWIVGLGLPLDQLPLYGLFGIPEGGTLRDAALLKSVVAGIFVTFVVPGVVYGRTVGSMRSDRDVIDAMAEAMSTMGLYIVLVFFAAQFVAFFGHSNLGAILAVLGADLLVTIGLDNALVFLPFILMCCFVNLMLGSASAQWAVTAPIFVPMLMGVGFSPEVIQAAYRIGDSSTNTITPMMSYFGLILAFVVRYDRRIGIGTLVATMLPYSIAFLTAWTILFYLWVFLFGLPVGPGSPTLYPAGG